VTHSASVQPFAPRVPVRMYDAANPDHIPPGAQVVAGYLDGPDSAWPTAAWNRHPQAVKVLITTTGDLRGNVADVENGDLTPADARGWIQAKQARGMRGATIYCSRARLAEVRAACRGHAYYLWVGDWTGTAHPLPGTVATQYAGGPDALCDTSMIYDQDWLDLIDQVNRPWPLA
jgi:hypothetical protein